MVMREWPVIYKDLLIVGNADSNVAVCTLWTEKNRVAERIGKSKFAACGNLYSAGGINFLLRNIFANPKIRFVVVFGADLTKTGDALLKLSQNGIDEKHCIKGTEIRIEECITNEDIDAMRKSVEFVDMRKNGFEELVKKIDELNARRMPAFGEPKYFPETTPEFSTLPSEYAGFLARENSIGEVWLKILDLIMKYGVDKPSEYGMRQKEIINLVSIIESDSKIEDYFHFDENALEDYYKSLLTTEKPEGIAYTYGERLLESDQVKNAIKKLREVPHTRRAFAFTLRFGDIKSDNPPCLTMINWNIQRNKLYQTAHFRSQDMFVGYPMNLFGLRKFQEHVANEVGVGLGSLMCVTTSAHVYENNWEEAKKILEEQAPRMLAKSHKLMLDPRGSFVISTHGDRLIAEHFTADGQKTQFRFEGEDPKMIYKEILAHNLVSRLDHAAYLGYELLRAATCIKSGKKFVQDAE